jgi:hypothetical protein
MAADSRTAGLTVMPVRPVSLRRRLLALLALGALGASACSAIVVHGSSMRPRTATDPIAATPLARYFASGDRRDAPFEIDVQAARRQAAGVAAARRLPESAVLTVIDATCACPIMKKGHAAINLLALNLAMDLQGAPVP